MDTFTPHTAILELHRLVDAALSTVLDAQLDLQHATESIMAIDRPDLEALVDGAGPAAALMAFERDGVDSGQHLLLVAEPALCNTLLERTWRTSRNPEAPITRVEHAVIQETLKTFASLWRRAWSSQGISTLPRWTFGGSLGLLLPQANSDHWLVARTVVMSQGEPVGVLLFCYPEQVASTLIDARRSITWRSRIARGLNPGERQLLDAQLSRLRNLVMPVRSTTSATVSLQILNNLETGDVIALDAPTGGELEVHMLDRTVGARLVRRGNTLALQITRPAGNPVAAPLNFDPTAGLATESNDPTSHIGQVTQ